MRYNELIFGFQKVGLDLGYFKQFIYGYDDRLNTSLTKDVNEEPENYPILHVPPQQNTITRDKTETYANFSIAAHKMAKVERDVSLSISSNVVTFSTSVFTTGDVVKFRDSRTNYEISIILSVTAGTATGTSYIDLADGTIISQLEEDHAAIHAKLTEELWNVLQGVKSFTGMTGTTEEIQGTGQVRVTRLDNYGSRGYVRVVFEFRLDNKNCDL